MSEKNFRSLHKLYAFITVAALVFIATFCQIAYASGTNNITVMSDEGTYVHESVVAGQHRAETTMLVGTDEEVTYYSYVKFPIDTVAPGIINSAVLRLYYSNATVPDGTFTLYGVTQTWSTESISYSNQPNSVYLSAATANEAGYIDFTVTASIISVIIGQYEGYGFKISYSGGTNTETVCLYTANHSDQTKKPQVIVNGSLFALGNIYSDVTLPINNCGTFKFLVPTNNGVATGTSVYLLH